MFTADGRRRLEAAARTWTCRHCEVTGAIRVEWRAQLQARKVGTWSLAGQQNKVSAVESDWPWAVCQPEHGGCGHESKGSIQQ